MAAPRSGDAEAGERRRAAFSVRLALLGARPGGTSLRLPLPDRDLRPATEASVRLLRAAISLWGPARGPCRSQSGSGEPDAARPGRVRRVRDPDRRSVGDARARAA